MQACSFKLVSNNKRPHVSSWTAVVLGCADRCLQQLLIIYGLQAGGSTGCPVSRLASIRGCEHHCCISGTAREATCQPRGVRDSAGLAAPERNRPWQEECMAVAQSDRSHNESIASTGSAEQCTMGNAVQSTSHCGLAGPWAV